MRVAHHFFENELHTRVIALSIDGYDHVRNTFRVNCKSSQTRAIIETGGLIEPTIDGVWQFGKVHLQSLSVTYCVNKIFT